MGLFDQLLFHRVDIHRLFKKELWDLRNSESDLGCSGVNGLLHMNLTLSIPFECPFIFKEYPHGLPIPRSRKRTPCPFLLTTFLPNDQIVAN